MHAQHAERRHESDEVVDARGVLRGNAQRAHTPPELWPRLEQPQHARPTLILRLPLDATQHHGARDIDERPAELSKEAAGLATLPRLAPGARLGGDRRLEAGVDDRKREVGQAAPWTTSSARGASDHARSRLVCDRVRMSSGSSRAPSDVTS